MKHHCPMCGEQWNDDVCEACGWFEGKPLRYSPPARRKAHEVAMTDEASKPKDNVGSSPAAKEQKNEEARV